MTQTFVCRFFTFSLLIFTMLCATAFSTRAQDIPPIDGSIGYIISAREQVDARARSFKAYCTVGLPARQKLFDTKTARQDNTALEIKILSEEKKDLQSLSDLCSGKASELYAGVKGKFNGWITMLNKVLKEDGQKKANKRLLDKDFVDQFKASQAAYDTFFQKTSLMYDGNGAGFWSFLFKDTTAGIIKKFWDVGFGFYGDIKKMKQADRDRVADLICKPLFWDSFWEKL